MAWKRSRVRIPSGPPDFRVLLSRMAQHIGSCRHRTVEYFFGVDFKKNPDCCRLLVLYDYDMEKMTPSDDVIFQPLHDEIVLLNMKTQQYYALDDVGSDMWNRLVQYGD